MKISNSKNTVSARLLGLPAILALMLMPLGFDHGSQSLISGNSALASEDGGHDSGGHTSGGHTSGGHSSGGHSSGGHSSDGHSSDGHSSGGKGAASSKGKGNPAGDQFGGGRATDPDAERGVGYHGGSSLESKVLRGSSAKGKGGPGGRGGKPEGAGGEDDHDHDDTTHDDSSHDDSSSKGRKPPNAGKPEGVGG